MSIPCKKLISGDTLSIISPSSPTSRELIDKSLKKLENLNFKYKIYDNLYKDIGYLAGTDIERAEDFNKALKDKETKGILCLRGGYGSIRMMDLIKWSFFEKNPKIFMGFSDLTPILNYIYKKFNVISFHSPMLTSDLDNMYSRTSLLTSITVSRKNYYIENPKNIDLESYSHKNPIATGNIVGGNLSLICSTLSTKYEIPFKNNILFIEEVNESPYKIDRMLTQLYLSKKIQQCSGIILGQFTGCSDNNGISVEEVLLEKINLFKKPCIYNLCSGHGEPRITLPIGAKCEINANDKTIKILEKVII